MPRLSHPALFPGPPVLGRGVVVGPGQPPPPGLGDVPRVVVDDEVAARPAHAATVLHHRWLRRQPVVVELAVGNDALRAPETCQLPPYRLDPDFEFARERLHFLMWANNWDHRAGEPVWWHGVLARRHGAAPSDVADVRLPDGTPAWCDGGPRGRLHNRPERRDDRGDHARDRSALVTVHRETIQQGRLTRAGDGEPVDDLAPDQLAAVAHPAGPARVVAPAGSGKTRVLTARLRHLLRDRGYEPGLVTAVAYNARAADELRARTSDLRANVRTLHSLALWICNQDERREVVDERGVRAILDDLVRVGRVPNQDPFQPYLEALAEIRLALRDPAEVEASRDDIDGLARLFDRYRQVLADRRLLDFDEQVYRAIELLLTRPDVRRRAQRAGTHLLVDEFQDLTPAFLLLIRLVAAPALQVFAVGDDDQCIYGHAGASPEYLVDFDRWFPGAAHHALEVNYRCPAEVVDAAVTLLGHNRRRVDKTIRSAPKATV